MDECGVRIARLVVVGSSAGSVEALSTLVSTLPANFPGPIVIAQHLGPSRISHLDELLEQHSSLPVRLITTTIPLENGVVYIVPDNQNVDITDHTIGPRLDDQTPLNSAIDSVFNTAARLYAEKLIAVFLTGSESDGANAARQVKEHDGTVIIQTPRTATLPALALGLAPTSVDIVADVEAIGPLLADLLTGVYMPIQPTDDRLLGAFLDQVQDRSGVDVSSDKKSMIIRRLERRMAAVGARKLLDYIGFLDEHLDEYQRLISSFLMKVTGFMQGADLFAYLHDSVFPDLVAFITTHRHGNDLRIWVAGCASGEEAYSVAMLLDDALGTQDDVSVRIFATDLDSDTVAFARAGIYPASAVANLPPEMVARCFTPVNSNYEVKKHIRSMIVFGEHDLSQQAPFTRVDLILCRHVLSHMTPDLQKRIMQSFAFSLRNKGYLILGNTDTLSQNDELFTLEQQSLQVYRRQGERLISPPSRSIAGGTLQSTRLTINPLLSMTSGIKQPRHTAHGSGTRRFNANDVLQHLPVGIVVVDQRYDIQSINYAARSMLGIYGTALDDDLVHLAQTLTLPSGRLRAVIDAAFRGETPAVIDEVVTAEIGIGQTAYLSIRCNGYRPSSEAIPDDLVVVTVTDITALVRQRQALEELVSRERHHLDDEHRQQQQKIDQQNTEIAQLSRLNGQLSVANMELISANLELRRVNEEYLLGNERAQAASEELETLNEELQTTNEELDTLNEELQATVEELNTTNDDLEARTGQIYEHAVQVKSQHQRMEMVLATMAEAILMIDGAGEIILTNAAFQAMFGPEGSAFLPEDEKGLQLPRETWPQVRAMRGDIFVMQFTNVTIDKKRRWYEAIGRPILTDTLSQGGVVVIRDITESRHHHT